MSRKVSWHCEGGHDFQMDTEFKPERCPICGGRDLERIEEQGPVARFLGGEKKGSKRKWWR